MDQTIINWLLSGFGALIELLLNAVWQAVKDLQVADTKLASKVAEIEILAAWSSEWQLTGPSAIVWDSTYTNFTVSSVSKNEV